LRCRCRRTIGDGVIAEGANLTPDVHRPLRPDKTAALHPRFPRRDLPYTNLIGFRIDRLVPLSTLCWRTGVPIGIAVRVEMGGRQCEGWSAVGLSYWPEA